MHKKIKSSMFGFLAIMSGLFSSCGSNAADPHTIEFWHTSGQGLTEFYERAASDFTKLVKENEGVDITIKCSYQGGYDDIYDKITKSFASGSTPTLAIAYPDHVADYLALEKTAGQYVVNLKTLADDSSVGFGKEGWIGDGEASDFVQTFYEEGQQYVRSGMYSLPFMKSTEVMYYNYDILKQFVFGFNPDLKSETQVREWMTTLDWDTFIDLAEYINKNKGANSSIEAPIWYDSDSNLFITQLYQRDIPYLSVDQTNNRLSVDFNNDKAKAFVTELKGYYDEGLLETKGTGGTYGSNNFVDRKSVFSIGSSGGAGYQDPTGQFSYGVCEVPYANKNKMYITQGPTLTLLRNPGVTDDVNDERVRYAWKFMKYLTSASVNNTLCLEGSEGYVPVRESCYKTEEYLGMLEDGTSITNETARVISEQIQEKYIVTPSVKGSAAARDAVGGLVTQVLLGNKTLDKAFSDAVDATKYAM